MDSNGSERGEKPDLGKLCVACCSIFLFLLTFTVCFVGLVMGGDADPSACPSSLIHMGLPTYLIVACRYHFSPLNTVLIECGSVVLILDSFACAVSCCATRYKVGTRTVTITRGLNILIAASIGWNIALLTVGIIILSTLDSTCRLEYTSLWNIAVTVVFFYAFALFRGALHLMTQVDAVDMHIQTIKRKIVLLI